MTSPERDPEERRGPSIVHVTPDLQPALADSGRFPGITPHALELPAALPTERIADWLGWHTLTASAGSGETALTCAVRGGEAWLLKAAHGVVQTRLECVRVEFSTIADLARWLAGFEAPQVETPANVRCGPRAEVVCDAPFQSGEFGAVASIWGRDSRDLWTAWSGDSAIGVLSGAFFPLHRGHRRFAEAAADVLERPIVFELTLANADKPPLDYISLDRRTGQFDRDEVLLTAAATFAEKSALLPGATFLLGWDTARRVLDRRFYSGGELESRLDQFAERGCRFLVAARREGNAVCTLSDLTVPSRYAELFVELPRARFLEEVSSTQLREAWCRGAEDVTMPKLFLESVRGPAL